MKKALIAPLKNLEMSKQGDMYMVLTHIALKNKEYVNFFVHQDKYKILDNGAFEGELRPIEEVVEIAALVKANEIILPDILYKKDETLEEMNKALTFLKNKGLRSTYKIMAVVQGSTQQEWLQCYQEMVKADIDVIGLSKLSCPKAFNMSISASRLHIAKLLFSEKPLKEIHLLGGSKDILDEISRHSSFIRSIDTSAPFNFGLRRKILGRIDNEELIFDINSEVRPYNKSFVQTNINLLMRE